MAKERDVREALAHVRIHSDSFCGCKTGSEISRDSGNPSSQLCKITDMLAFRREEKPFEVSGIKKHKQISRLYSDLIFFFLFLILKYTGILHQIPSRW